MNGTASQITLTGKPGRMAVYIGTPEPLPGWLTKAEYAEHVRCSTRFLEYRLAEGLPSELRFGKRVFNPPIADEWLRREGHIT